MARKETVIVVCDLDVDDVAAVGTVEIHVDDEHVTLDLCAVHLDEFKQLITRWRSGVATAPVPSTSAKAGGGTSKVSPPKRSRARSGSRAATDDMVAPLRDRIPPAVQAAFDARKKR